MKSVVRFIIGIVGILIVWVVMFGFDGGRYQGLLTSTVYAQSVTNKVCDGVGDKECDTVCNNSSSDLNCKAYFEAKDKNEKNFISLANNLDQFLTFLYLIMWPLLYVGGMAMDNGLIYGEIFGITGLLYQFWGIMRTVANFLIVFILVRTIGSEMFEGSKGSQELGKKLLAIAISSILVNMSWFLIGAMVDVSTIATYGVGTLPLKLDSGGGETCNQKIENFDDIKKLGTCRPIISTHTILNFTDILSPDKAQRKSYYSYKPAPGKGEKQYFLSCIFKFNKVSEGDWIDFVKRFEDARKNGGVRTSASGETGTIIGMPKDAKINPDYCVLNSNDLFKIKGANTEVGSTDFNDRLVSGIKDLHARGGQNIRKMIEGQNGMIGVMYTMYGNLLGFINIKSSVNGFTIEGLIIQFMIKGFFGLAIMFPLIALCIVLVMRIAYLRIVVGFSPLLVIGWTLEKMGIKNEYLKSLMNGIGKDITLSNIVGLLLQPVFVVFVISLGMMFLEALQTSTIDGKGFSDSLQCDVREKCCSVVETFNLCFEKFNIESGVDTFFHYFTGSIVNIIGIMLLYFMVFAVIKSNAITKKVGQQIQDFGTNYMGSIPIVPRWDEKGNFGGERVGVAGAKKGLSDSWATFTAPTEDNTAKTVVQPPIEKFFESVTGKVNSASQKVSKALAEKDFSDEALKGVKGRQEAGNALIEAIGTAKKDAKLEYTSADQFVNKSDKNVEKLFKKYDVDNLTDLLAHPRFIAETGSTSSTLLDKISVNSGWSKANETIKTNYLKKLNKNKELFTKINSDMGYIVGRDGERYLVKFTADSKTKDILSLDASSSTVFKEYKGSNYDDIINLSGKFTKDELKIAIGDIPQTKKPTENSEGLEVITNKDGKEEFIKKPKEKIEPAE